MLRGVANTPRVVQAEALAHDPISEVDMARRWMRLRQANPELLGDLIRLGGVLNAQPMMDGEVMPMDGMRLAYEAGRRDFALQLASMMALTHTELSDMMENADA
jgi:hypothetical protein